MLKTRSFRLFVLAVVLSPVLSWASGHAESLAYGVVYRGIFSMGMDMRIADVELRSRPAVPGGLAEIRLEASSAAYPVVESLYPIRYRFRTWTDAEGGLVAFETYEKTTRLRHRLHYPDTSKRGSRRLDLTRPGIGQAELASLAKGRRPPGLEVVETLLSDRLGLLQRVREKPMYTGAEYRFDVTSGRGRFDYRVRVDKADRLHMGDAELVAWKVRFDGDRIKDGEREPAHRPLYVWLSRDGGHIPLRVDSRHAAGLFKIELKDRARLQRLAGLSR